MERYNAVFMPLVHNKKLFKKDCSDKVDPTVYNSLIGSLLYLITTRLDLMFATSLLSSFMNSLGQVHLRVAKRVLRYVKGIVDYGILYSPLENGLLQAYSNNDWARSVDDIKSTFAYVFSLSLGVFSWNSKKQEAVTQSSVKVEY